MPALALSRSGSPVHSVPHSPRIQLPLSEQTAYVVHRRASLRDITTNSIPHDDLCGFHLGIGLVLDFAHARLMAKSLGKFGSAVGRPERIWRNSAIFLAHVPNP